MIARKLKTLNSRITPLKTASFILFSVKGGDPTTASATVALLRLHPPYQVYPRRLLPLQVSTATSGKFDSGGVTGGVYKARERIHHSVLICDY